ncbi:MAG: type II secretion system protein [Opitutaceae bacterium]
MSPHNPGRAFPRTQQALRRAARAGFTLLELLGVIALVGILAGLVFTAADGARERARRAQAKAELAVLGHALEAFRAAYGDYPVTGSAENDPSAAASADDSPGILFNALAGRRGPQGTLGHEGRCFISSGAHAPQRSAWPVVGDTAPVANALLDPWGRRYLYYYRTGAAWTRRAPLLLSAGPDGALAPPGELAAWDGSLPAGGANADNLVAGE